MNALFQQRLNELMKLNKVAEVAVAVAVGVSQPTVNRWRTTDKVPDLNELIRLAEYFAVPPAYFYAPRGADDGPIALRETAPDYLVDEALADAARMAQSLDRLQTKLGLLKERH